MWEDPRLQEFEYSDGVITGCFDLGEAWDIPGDSKFRIHISTEVPVDGMGTPATTLATWRQVCSNGAVAEAPMFRTKMEIKDNGGEHFRRLLKSFSNPRGIELLHERLVAANATKASVDEVWQAESFIRHQVCDSRHQMLLCERLQDVAENPCVRYGVTDLGAIGGRRRGLLPTGASVADVMNFISELNTHHGMLLRNQNAANGLIGTFCERSFDRSIRRFGRGWNVCLVRWQAVEKPCISGLFVVGTEIAANKMSRNEAKWKQDRIGILSFYNLNMAGKI